VAWNIDFLAQADKQLDKLDEASRKRILTFLHKRIATLENPRSIGEDLKGKQFSGLWKYRVSDIRVICQIKDKEISILVVKIGNRREVYKKR
jgi:mRNA interferase RelE/StbE